MSSTLSAGTVRLDVGSPTVPFDVHIELICACSPYFDQWFKDRPATITTEHLIRLSISFPEEDPEVFAELISWMYCRELSANLTSKQSIFVCKIWVLAQRFEMPELQNAVMSVIGKILPDNWLKNTIPLGEIVNYIYSHTLSGSMLRLVVSDTYSQNATSVQFSSDRQGLTSSFLEDLCLAFVEERASRESVGIEPTISMERYFVPLTPSKDDPRDSSVPSKTSQVKVDYPQRASPAQLQSRKIHRHTSRVRRSSPAVSSTSTATPNADTSSVDPESVLSQDMDRLNVSPVFGRKDDGYTAS